MKSNYIVTLENRKTGKPKKIPWESESDKRGVWKLFRHLGRDIWSVKSVEVSASNPFTDNQLGITND